jgi:hypothetical protein
MAFAVTHAVTSVNILRVGKSTGRQRQGRASFGLALACLLLAVLPPAAAYGWVSRVYVDGGYISGGVPYHDRN